MMIRPTDLVVTRWGARFMGRRFPCSIGRGGITNKKREGDGATPRGIWKITGSGIRSDRIPAISTVFPQFDIGPTDIWSDDPKDPAYNHHLNNPGHVFSHEKLRRADPLYDLVLFTNHNWPHSVPGHGSAIFIHRWRKPRHPTEGCVAFCERDLHWIAHKWTEKSRLVIT